MYYVRIITMTALLYSGFTTASGPYVGFVFDNSNINYTELRDFERPADTHTDTDVQSFQMKLGYQLNSHVALEFRGGKGKDKGTITIDPMVTLSADITQTIGLYTRIQPAGDVIAPYLIIGFTEGELAITANDLELAKDSLSDFSYGAGISIHSSEHTEIHLEYLNYLDKDGFEIKGTNFSLTLHF